MFKLKDVPIIFVHYPTGAGGWFLASLIWHAFDPREPFRFDARGSGHDNQAIRNINNFYTEILESKEGMQIIHDTDYDSFSYQERIDYLRDNLTATDYAPHTHRIPQVISLHCCNVNLFLDAFPNSKCIQITVEDSDWLECTGNFLRKKVHTREKFNMFCTELGIADLDILWDKYQHLAENIKDFQWAIDYIKSTAKNIENKLEFDHRIFEISYKDYMTDDIDNVLLSLLRFSEFETENKFLYDNLYTNMLMYRGQQLEYTI